MEEIRERELNIVGEHYGSFFELYRTGDARPLNAMWAKRRESSVLSPMEVTGGTYYSAPNTRRALLYGSQVFQEAFKEQRVKAAKSLRDRYDWRKAPTQDTAVSGQHVIVERFMAGHPESFRRTLPQARRKKSVAIFYDAACAGSTPVKTRIKAGCALLAAVEALGKMGYEVQLSYALALFSGDNQANDPTLLLEVMLKDYGEAFSEQKLQFPLAGKPVLFHMGCWWAHRFAALPYDYGVQEGFPVSLNAQRVVALQEYAVKRGGVYISQDMIELRLGCDPIKVLESILSGVSDYQELQLHTRTRTPMGAAANPQASKMLHSWAPNAPLDPWGEQSVSLRPKASAANAQEQSTQRVAQAQRLASQESAARQAEPLKSSGQQESPAQRSQAEGAQAQNANADASQQAAAASDSGDAPQNDQQQESIGQDLQDDAPNAQEQPGGSQQQEGDGATTQQQAGNKGSGPGGSSEQDEDGAEEPARVIKADEEDAPQLEDEAFGRDLASDDFIIACRKRFIAYENGETLKFMLKQRQKLIDSGKMKVPGFLREDKEEKSVERLSRFQW